MWFFILKLHVSSLQIFTEPFLCAGQTLGTVEGNRYHLNPHEDCVVWYNMHKKLFKIFSYGTFLVAGTWIQSLVRELRPHMPRSN